MYFWKIDEESIHCLINDSEIRDMGYDIKELSTSHDLMGRFLEEIVRNSFKYVHWNADNGIQTYVARALPAGQYLLTISCTFVDVAIDRDLDQIRMMTDAISEKITHERIDRIYSLEGEEKEKAFEALARDLHAICSGEAVESEEDRSGDVKEAGFGRQEDWSGPGAGEESVKRAGKNERKKDQGRPEREENGRRQTASSGVYLFRSRNLKDMTSFCAGLGRKFRLPSVLYRCGESYVLEVAFPGTMRKDEVLYCVMAGEEYGAEVKIDKYESNYLREHGTKVIGEDAINVLRTLQ